ncbi:MAG: carboxypeptidase-like regulatory domain-containing protein [Hymenobacteraceae bacterium]|nr:carboxypeptidase-like regulatory domain-containing protein [Hymenobacteraceae bacterium]
MLCSLPSLAQRSIRVSGTVLESDRKTPIPGASVVKINSQLGVISDEEGKFLIDVAQEDTLLIRAVGFKPLLYLPKQLPVSEIRVNIVLQEDSVMLGEVEVTSRPSPEMIQRALRNMKQKQTSQVKKPGYIPGLEPPPAGPPPPPTVMSPATLLYDLLSREGKEKRKLQELLLQQAIEQKMK